MFCEGIKLDVNVINPRWWRQLPEHIKPLLPRWSDTDCFKGFIWRCLSHEEGLARNLSSSHFLQKNKTKQKCRLPGSMCEMPGRIKPLRMKMHQERQRSCKELQNLPVSIGTGPSPSVPQWCPYLTRYELRCNSSKLQLSLLSQDRSTWVSCLHFHSWKLLEAARASKLWFYNSFYHCLVPYF